MHFELSTQILQNETGITVMNRQYTLGTVLGVHKPRSLYVRTFGFSGNMS